MNIKILLTGKKIMKEKGDIIGNCCSEILLPLFILLILVSIVSPTSFIHSSFILICISRQLLYLDPNLPKGKGMNGQVSLLQIF